MHPRIALALICKGSNDEAKLLDRCLESVSPYVDGIFITRTQKPGEKKNQAVAKVARKYKAHLSDFEWVYDFAAARNFNFSQVPKDFTHIMWTDADDVWRGLEKLKDVLKDHPHTDGFGFWYLYDWDEFKLPTVVHRKTMVVKNDGCVHWVGALHEDLMETRELDIHLVNGIERLHLTYKERADAAAQRNLEIAAKEAASSDDPRSLWNLANAYYSVQDYTNARKAYDQFIEETGSDEEKFLALMRAADACKDDPDAATTYLQRAIGLRPNIPDAYFQMGYHYFNQSNWDKAEEYMWTGLRKKPQVHRSIVFNPRDYDYNPMMLMARIYYHKNRPHDMLTMLEGCLQVYPNDERLIKLVEDAKEEKEEMRQALTVIDTLEKLEGDALKDAIDALDPEIRSHPAICAIRNQNFIKTESSGKDLVIYCGRTTHQWNPDLFRTKGFGGSEEAVIHLAREWAKLGWNVTVYNNCGHKAIEEHVDLTKPRATGTEVYFKNTITYRPFWEWNYRDKQDITILWRWCKPLDAEINSTKIFVDVHDVVPPGEFNEARLRKVDKVFVKTQFHRSLFPNVPDEKIVVVPNGFEGYLDPSIKKDPYLVINTSSPDRSMDVLPTLWRRVREQFPRARMQWMYGWDNFKNSFAGDSKKMAWMKEIQQNMKDAGIEDLGRLTQAEVGRKYQEAGIFAYPTHFAEIDCISVKKAQLGGAFPITSDFGALAESNVFGAMSHSKKTKDTWAKPYQFHFGMDDEEEQDEWVRLVVEQLKNPKPMDMHSVALWAEGMSWENTAMKWNKVFTQ